MNEGSEHEEYTVDEMITKLNDRVSSLEEAGADVSKVLGILESIKKAQKELDNGDADEEEIRTTLKKTQDYLDIISGEHFPQKENDQKKNLKEGRGDTGKKRVKVQRILKKKEKIAPDLDLKYNEIKDKLDMVQKLGGEKDPIMDHMANLKSARNNGDVKTFMESEEIVRNWIDEYLLSLLNSSIESRILKINSRLEDIKTLGGEGETGEIEDQLDSVKGKIESGSVEDLETVLKQIGEIQTLAKAVHSDFIEKARKELPDRISGIRKLLEDFGDLVDRNKFQDEIDSVMETEDEVLKLRSLDDIEEKIRAAASVSAKQRVDRFLLSVDPLIEKVGELMGDDSEEKADLMNEKEEVLEQVDHDPISSMEKLESLLDRAANSVANAEEKVERDLRSSLDEERSLVSGMKEKDSKKIEKILDNVTKVLIEGDYQKARIFLDRARTAREKIQERYDLEEIISDVDIIKERSSELSDFGLDTSSLRELISEIESKKQNAGVEQLRSLLDRARSSLEVVEGEYEKKKLEKDIISAEEDLENSDHPEAEPLKESLIDIKSLFDRGDYGKAKELFSESKSRIEAICREKSVRTTLESLTRMILNAESLGMEVEPYKNGIKEIRELLENDDLREADRRSRGIKENLDNELHQRSFQVLEEDIMDLVDECVDAGFDPGNYESTISMAKKLAEDGEQRGSLKVLQDFKDELNSKFADKRAKMMISSMEEMIKKARTIGVEVATYKASLTKARVRLEAGDVKGSIKEVENKMRSLEEKMDSLEYSTDEMDSLRGVLIAQEGRIQILEGRNVEVGYLRDLVTKARESLQSGNLSEGRQIIDNIKYSVSKMLSRSVRDHPGKVDEKPVEREEVEKEQTEPLEVIPPEKARKELFTLIPRISTGIKEMVSAGEDPSVIRSDLQMIKEMFASKRYIEAYRASKKCIKKLED